MVTFCRAVKALQVLPNSYVKRLLRNETVERTRFRPFSHFSPKLDTTNKLLKLRK